MPVTLRRKLMRLLGLLAMLRLKRHALVRPLRKLLALGLLPGLLLRRLRPVVQVPPRL